MAMSSNWTRTPPFQGVKCGFESRHRYQIMRKPKPIGIYNKPHSADECGICAKPERYKKQLMEREMVEEQLELLEEPLLDVYVCGCGRIDCIEDI